MDLNKLKLYVNQKRLLDTFLNSGAISKAQYDKSFGDLTEKMGFSGKKVISVIAGLFTDDDKFLIYRRPEGKARAGLWEFPGGKTEVGETDGQTLIRECREELNVSVVPEELYITVGYEYPDVTVLLSLYKIRQFTGEMHANEGGLIKWITVDEICNYEFCPADGEILLKLKGEGL